RSRVIQMPTNPSNSSATSSDSSDSDATSSKSSDSDTTSSNSNRPDSSRPDSSDSDSSDDEPDNLMSARNWPLYKVNADDAEASITKTGYKLTFLLSDDETTLGDLGRQEQLQEISTVLKENLNWGNFQYLLPPPDDAEELLVLTSCIPSNILESPDGGPYALQPLPSALNRQIGLGMVENLTYYFYSVKA
ncbi:hypothetical protein JCM3774_004085, partial [Rhodotorula dairenensis]